MEFCGGNTPSLQFQKVVEAAQDQSVKRNIKYPVEFSEEELKTKLEPIQFCVTRECGTETSFSGQLLQVQEDGVFKCVVCSVSLFSTETKFESGTGWPSFTCPTSEKSLRFFKDYSIENRPRIETVCGSCGAHLGHVFDDGPQPGHLRYCINSVCLTFKPLAPET